MALKKVFKLPIVNIGVLLLFANMSKAVFVDTEDLQQLHRSIAELKELILHNRVPNNGDEWISSQEMRDMLHIGKRTEITYRKRRIIAYSKYLGKIYYKRRDVFAHLERHYVKSYNNGI